MRAFPAHRRGSRAGVTLMELLIAVTLVSLLSTGLLWAMRVGLHAMERTNGRMIQNRRQLGARRVLEQQFAGLMPVLTDCARSDGPPGGPRVLFFQGEPGTLRFVTSYSLEEASRGYPRIAEFAVIPGRYGIGVRLIVNETVWAGPSVAASLCLGMRQVANGVLPAFGPVEARPSSFVLADRLRECRFLYQFSDARTGAREWTPSWVFATLPAAVRIEMIPIDPDPSNPQMRSLTLPVRVDRSPVEAYPDVDPPRQ